MERRFVVFWSIAIMCMMVASNVSAKHPEVDYDALFENLGGDYGDPQIAEIVNIMANLTRQTFASGFPWLRQAHPKQHGCVQAIVTPYANIDPSLAVGVFASPEPIAAFIRFSNGVGRGFNPPGGPVSANESDIVPDIRGCAIKLVNVTGPFIDPNATTQVFTMTTDRVAFLPDIPSALAFFSAVQQGLGAFTLWGIENPRQLLLFGEQAVVIDDLLTTNFSSPVPSVHGDTYVKHHIYPNPNNFQKLKREKQLFPSFNYLRDELISDLNPGTSDGARFTWSVQVYENEYYTPLNDSTIEWTNEFIDIAEIYIPPQNSWDQAQDNFCTFMSFNPGFSLPEHQPYGPIQEIRKAVYGAMATLRHRLDSQENSDISYQDWLDFPTM